MSRDTIIEAIRAVLRDDLGNTRLSKFRPEARLNEELHLDSIQLLQLFLNLELKHGLSASEEAIGGRSIETVSDIVDVFDAENTAEPEPPAREEPESVHGETYYDLKIHCFVSCVCAALKARKIDHRPFYFPVWDAHFAATARHQLRYHDPAVGHRFFRGWFQQVYGVRLVEWYDPHRSKDDNVAVLLDLVENRKPSESVMVMLDMYHLPERENKFNQNPFPHYLMLEAAEDPAMFRVLDPDFRWEGEIARETVLNAVRQPTVGGGYVFDGDEAKTPDDADVAALFEASFHEHENPLFSAVRGIVAAHVEGRDGVALPDLASALGELPVISIRKYAYEHGFAYFWRALALPDPEFHRWCDEIDALFQGLKRLHYAALKLSETRDRSLAPDIFAEIDRLDALETAIKARLAEVFALWRADRGLAAPAWRASA